jgi:8-oxo-dGTP diphosphatase
MDRTNTIAVVARAFIRKGNQVLLCQAKDAGNWYFLPGGHVEYGESLTCALLRELEEEVCLEGMKIKALIGTVENKFPVGDRIQHELNFIFEAEEINEQVIQSRESHLEFSFHDIDALKDIKLLPKKVKEGLLGWLETGDCFWKEFESESGR